MLRENNGRAVRGDTLKGFLWEHRGHFWFYTLWRTVSVLAVVPFPWISQKIVDEAIPRSDLRAVWVYTGFSLGLMALHFLSMQVAAASLSVESQLLFRKLRSRIFHKLNFMHFGFLDSVQTGRLLSKYAFDTSNIETTVLQIVAAVLPELIRAAFTIVTLAWINPWLLLIVLVCLPVFGWVRYRYFRPIEENNRVVQRAREKMTGQASEFISAIKLVRGFGQEQLARQQMEALSDAYSSSRESQMRLNQSLGYVLFTVMTVLSLFAVAFCAWLAIEGKMTVGALVALVGALPVCLSPVNVITQFSMQYLLGVESYRSIKELMDSAYVEKWNGKRLPEPMRGEIAFREVGFAYDKEKERRAIRGFSAVIRPGEHVAFVGPSGSGKSTLISLMLGFYAPTEGEILLDGIPQSELAVREFRQRCAIVMQDNLLLSGTLMENIRFGKPSATAEEVAEAARNANATEFIDRLPEGFETRVGERGVSLSGGQRQRIAIARALLRDPKILIFDEATSALDYESERAVQEAIDRLARGRTTITIAHRLSTIRGADRIFMLRGGALVAEGTWEELAGREGAFKDLLAAQS